MSPETTALMGEAVPLIRHHLWQSNTPPKSPDKRPWSIARELNIWKRLVKAGFPPADLNGAITVIRTVRPYDGPMRLTWFYGRKLNEAGDVEWTGTTLLEMCVGYHHKNQGQDRKHKARLPDSVRSVLKDMAR